MLAPKNPIVQALLAQVGGTSRCRITPAPVGVILAEQLASTPDTSERLVGTTSKRFLIARPPREILADAIR
jgi:hypothetical protein